MRDEVDELARRAASARSTSGSPLPGAARPSRRAGCPRAGRSRSARPAARPRRRRAGKSSGCARWSAPLSARRRSGCRRSAARRARARRRAARAHSRSKRTWSATAPGPAKRSQSPIQNACRARNASSSAGSPAPRARRAARASRRTPSRGMYGEPSSSGGPSGSTCHHDWPGRGEPVDERDTPPGPSRPPGSEVRCSRIPLERGRFIGRRAQTRCRASRYRSTR